jgi:hypothetical protein
MGCCSARSEGRRNLACSCRPCCIRRFSAHGGLQPIAQHPAAADAFQPPLRCGFQARLSSGVRRLERFSTGSYPYSKGDTS